MSDEPFFGVVGQGRYLEGPVLGLTQPAFMFTMAVRLPAGIDLAWLDSHLGAMTEEALPPFPDRSDAEALLVMRAAYWSGGFQRFQKIPVSARFWVGRGRPAGDKAPGLAHAVLFPVAMPVVSRQANAAALDWVTGSIRRFLTDPAVSEQGFNASGLMKELAPLGAPGINSYRFMRAADRLDVPVSPVLGQLVQYGIGRHSRWMASSLIDSTSGLGVQMANNKLNTAAALRRAGLPAPVHGKVADEDAAVAKARQLGYPVVVKPADKERGVGVAAGLSTEEAVRSAFAHARQASASVLVEKHVEGSDFRLTVFEGRVLQVIGRRPGGVVGDGRCTLAELVAQEATTPDSLRRQREHRMPPLSLDAEALGLARERGMRADTVVPEGLFVALRRRANVSSGGVPISIPVERVHPDNIAVAIDAAAALRLNLAGVDLMVPDIGSSWMETGGIICEVNAQPQISRTGSPDIYADILSALLGPAHTIPIWLYMSPTPPPTVPGLASASSARVVGYSSLDGGWLNGRRTGALQPNSFRAARALLADSRLDAAVVHMTPQDVVAFGLPASRIHGAAVDTQALTRSEAMAYLLPHVSTTLILPSSSAGTSMAANGPRTCLSDDPWKALSDAAFHYQDRSIAT